MLPAICLVLTVLDNIEITIETNPKTFDEKKLEYYKRSKINIGNSTSYFSDKSINAFVVKYPSASFSYEL